MSEMMVSICVLSYNHEKYLRDCLDGIVMQRVSFPIEAWIHDDASTDSSADIIKEYQQKYPNIIKPILQTENQYSKRNGGILAKFVYPKCSGKYIALCEGDDYWTDPYKLQKQVEFLESHPDYSMCCHGAAIKNETSQKENCACEYMTTREYFPIDAYPTWQIPTASIVFRYKQVMSYPLVNERDFSAGDVVLILRCMAVGRVWGFADHMSVYRMNSNGATCKPITKQDLLHMCKHHDAIKKNFPFVNSAYGDMYVAMINYTMFRKSPKFFQKLSYLWTAVSHSPLYVVEKILKVKLVSRNELFYQHYKC